MKSITKILLLLFGIGFLFTGCYTVVWDPSQEFPSDQTSNDTSEFYDTDYYGGYYGFYETPWWIAFPPSIAVPNNDQGNTITRNLNNGRSNEVESSRNSGGRGYTDDNGRTFLPPPTTSSGSNSSGTVSKPPTTTRDSGSNNNSDSNTSTTSSNNSSSSNNNGRSSGSSNTRNDSGSRNSGSGRR